MATWLIPFKGRNSSASVNVNFLWKHENIYFMDNHRMALWCWLQHIDPKDPSTLFHIDRHYDALPNGSKEWPRVFPNPRAIPLPDYDAATEPGTNFRLVTWDNYLAIFLDNYGGVTDKLYLMTHDQGCKPIFPRTLEPPIWDLPENLAYWISSSVGNVIVNIDLDYFITDQDATKIKMITDAFIEQLFLQVKQEFKRIAVLTISLSPEACGSWALAEHFAALAANVLQVPFKLP
jgi:hypothetical protein